MDTVSSPAALLHATAPARLWRHREFLSFAAIGVVSTLAYVVLYSVLRPVAVPAVANALALLITAAANTAANRRITFDVRGRSGIARDHAAGLLALGVALTITSVSLAALGVLAPRSGPVVELAVLVVANALATLIRFLVLRAAIQKSWNFQERVATSLATLSRPERIRR
jgi:putative flippase GtrA